MGLINDDAAVLGQQEVLLQLSQQNTIRHELEGGFLADLAIIPHLQPSTLSETAKSDQLTKQVQMPP